MLNEDWSHRPEVEVFAIPQKRLARFVLFLFRCGNYLSLQYSNCLLATTYNTKRWSM